VTCAGETSAFYARASQYRIASYHNLGRNPKEWRRWLAFRGPILTRLEIDQTWINEGIKGGKLDKYVKAAEPMGHAIALVGYTPGHFIIRNSWGVEWGDQGFAYASDAYARAALTEAYGVHSSGDTLPVRQSTEEYRWDPDSIALFLDSSCGKLF
jgi:hypothetical protein